VLAEVRWAEKGLGLPPGRNTLETWGKWDVRGPREPFGQSGLHSKAASKILSRPRKTPPFPRLGPGRADTRKPQIGPPPGPNPSGGLPRGTTFPPAPPPHKARRFAGHRPSPLALAPKSRIREPGRAPARVLLRQSVGPEKRTGLLPLPENSLKHGGQWDRSRPDPLGNRDSPIQGAFENPPFPPLEKPPSPRPWPGARTRQGQNGPRPAHPSADFPPGHPSAPNPPQGPTFANTAPHLPPPRQSQDTGNPGEGQPVLAHRGPKKGPGPYPETRKNLFGNMGANVDRSEAGNPRQSGLPIKRVENPSSRPPKKPAFPRPLGRPPNPQGQMAGRPCVYPRGPELSRGNNPSAPAPPVPRPAFLISPAGSEFWIGVGGERNGFSETNRFSRPGIIPPPFRGRNAWAGEKLRLS